MKINATKRIFIYSEPSERTQQRRAGDEKKTIPHPTARTIFSFLSSHMYIIYQCCVECYMQHTNRHCYCHFPALNCVLFGFFMIIGHTAYIVIRKITIDVCSVKLIVGEQWQYDNNNKKHCQQTKRSIYLMYSSFHRFLTEIIVIPCGMCLV